MTDKPIDRLFRRFNIISIITVYLLILAGGIVRSTGSGMGCPDWPKCFGSYIPPTDISQLPEDYKEIYSDKRHQKNLKVASMLSAIGLNHLADKITKDDSILIEQTFNPLKTWIEYINRVLGVLVGFFILLSCAKSFSYWKTDRRIVFMSISALVLVIFIGWVGSIVVSTNLMPGMITFHMLLAIGLIALLLKLHFETKESPYPIEKNKRNIVRDLIVAAIIIFLTQIVLGTQVREAIDNIAAHLGPSAREEWIGSLGLTFFVHRSYSLVILLLHIGLLIHLFKSYNLVGLTVRLVIALVVLIVLEIGTGAVLAYFALPFMVQPIHLFLALVIFGIQYYLLMIINEGSRTETQLAHA